MIRAVAMALAVWIGLIAIVLTARHEVSAPAKPPVAVQARQDELARCRAIGEGAANDAACHAAWAKARARFFGRDAS
ncbi:putative entry exclusion protein TrbK-alt [Caulobacter sp. UNC279MFTsu5.1]|uniref:putative entry exclusion protein TrbK-alt n=1 Tax=Caulobacter sp. UNC279MFTsu5.1 TaxID=1502775 RepID=UPI000360B01F|nr:putative entry exclusion protein TrbK-alt [Caulobacter sp. UNC279MFTsu5.1]SFI56297.1 conjugative transfer region protein TrbK [Caulobacter sp. UNC279MFTsu5.1]